MSNLNPLMFLVPVIALILVVLLFIHLLKKADNADNKVVFKRFTFITLVSAFLLNFIWEVIQMPLYKNTALSLQSVAFCGLASAADAIMVLLIYFCFALLYKKPLWIEELTASRVFFLIVVGGIGAILAEMRHVSAGNWAYDQSMPILPIVDVGLSPVLQFMLLPALIYYLSFKMRKL